MAVHNMNDHLHVATEMMERQSSGGLHYRAMLGSRAAGPRSRYRSHLSQQKESKPDQYQQACNCCQYGQPPFVRGQWIWTPPQRSSIIHMGILVTLLRRDNAR